MKQLGLDLADPPRLRREAALESFHVRSHMPVDEVLKGERRAARQEDQILTVFQVYPGIRMTPSSLIPRFPAWPLTSIRRAITNLTTVGLLTHHKADRRPGIYGAKESTWSLSVSPGAETP